MTPEAVKRFCKAVAGMSVIFGACGMFLCAPILLWDVSIPMIQAASLPFIAGAILIAGGLVSFTMLLEK
jgi:hypothetical protein